MGEDDTTDLLVCAVPSSMQIVSHDIKPVNDGVDGDNVEVAHVPIRGWLN